MRARELREILRGRNFRRLYATRLTSQLTDGVFQVALAGYVFFSPERQTTAGKAAAAFAVTLLPYSALGPFAGVFIDRWQRRQILLWTPILRAVLVLFVAGLVMAGEDGVVFFLGVLVVLGVNRFFLAALSAALPHVVRRDHLVTANAFAVTSGTIIAFTGAGLGYLLRRLFGGGTDGTALILVSAAALFLAAGIIATSLPRRLLGPYPSENPYSPRNARSSEDASQGGNIRPLEDASPNDQGSPAGPNAMSGRVVAGGDLDGDVAKKGSSSTTAPQVREALGTVLSGLADGGRHIMRRRQAALALGAISFHRLLYGVILIMTLLLCRNTFSDDADEGLTTFAVMLGVSGAGYFAAALITPAVVRRISKPAWVACLLGGAAASLLLFGLPYTEPAWAAGAFALGVVSQGVKLCVDTTLQESIDDAYRGRVFAVYDMLFNATFAASAAVAAALLPSDGRAHLALAGVITAYAVGAVVYRAAASRVREPVTAVR
ncbi:MFS transporter [Actinomadura graeca]|uniref:MFS transporter n=1 Tax=Actinomadura graeca TaxID=2750812 RepID=A0ABX8QW08_9ACTN|nr:MFS transporter [Actinomadura graeca]QXJ23035.1 MFS transporter [Actinomadura graeca]